MVNVYPVIFAPCSGRLHGDSHPLPEPSACNAEQYVSADIISLVDLDSDAGCRVHGNYAVLCNVILPVRLDEKRARPVAMLSGWKSKVCTIAFRSGKWQNAASRIGLHYRFPGFLAKLLQLHH